LGFFFTDPATPPPHSLSLHGRSSDLRLLLLRQRLLSLERRDRNRGQDHCAGEHGTPHHDLPSVSHALQLGQKIAPRFGLGTVRRDRKSTRLNSSHRTISYAVFCLKKK